MVQTKTPCSRCGAQNLETAPFCWQCQTRFPQPGRTLAGYQRPGVAFPPVGKPARERPWYLPKVNVKASIAASLVFLVVVPATLYALARARVDLPPRIAGAEQLDTSQSRRFEKGLEEGMMEMGVVADVAVYQTPAGYPFAVGALDTGGIGKATPFLEGVASGLDASGEGHVFLSKTVERSHQGASFACAPVRIGPSPAGGVCTWRDNVTDGFVFGPLLSMRGALDLTFQAQEAVRNN